MTSTGGDTDRRVASVLADPAVRLSTVLTAAAAVLTAAVWHLGAASGELRVVGIVVLAVAMAGGEAIRVDLPYRRGGMARFTLSDAALTAGLFLLPPREVVLAALACIVVIQVAERVPAFKLAFNVAQWGAAAAGAALVTALTHPEALHLAPIDLAPAIGPRAFASVAAGLGVFLLVNTVAVGAIIAATGGGRFAPTIGRIAPTSAILAGGNACMGLLAVLLLDTHPWALPALAVPLTFLHAASSQRVHAQLQGERSTAMLHVEQQLSLAQRPEEVAAHLVQGVVDLLGGEAAVWRAGAWLTPVPLGSGGCPVDGSTTTALQGQGPVLGPATDQACAAVGMGSGVLVAWGEELGADVEATGWLERLGRSGSVSFARIEAALTLEAERATLRAVVDGTADGIFVVGGDGRIRLWNPAMAALAGADADEVLGRDIAEVLGDGPWEDLAGGAGRAHDVVRSTGDSAAGGDVVWRVSLAAVADREEGMLHVAAVHDVSAERRVARMKDDMLAVVSHELRTPLTPIKASAQLLRRRWERLTPAQREELLAQVDRRADHLARLVDDLLLVGQLSAGGASTPAVMPVPCDLSAVLVDDVNQLALARTDHEITLSAPETVPALCDPLRLRQIVDNLVDNACKYSPAGARVDVRLEVEGATAVLRVADHGRGIPAADLDRVFERFERVDDPLLMTTSGAGLGLYIVRALVEALGGTISLSSVLGAGTTVTVRLPLSGRRATEDAVPAAAQPVEDTGPEGSSSSSRVSSSARPPSS